jgi:hypothetical protein
MSKPKQTAETVIHESAISRIEPVPQIPSTWAPPAEPSWDRARALVADVRRSISSIINLGMEIQALKDEYFAQGARKDVLGRLTVTANVEKGWNQAVQDELGIHYSTAYRIMERAYSVVCMRQLELGEPVSFQDGRTREMRVIEPTPEMQEQATQALEAVVAGTVAAPRAWAGLVGEATRRANQGGSAARAATDHAANIARAITALRNSLKSWKHLDPHDRADLEKQWQGVLAVLPETMRP